MSRLTVRGGLSALTHVGVSLPVKRRFEETPEAVEPSCDNNVHSTDSLSPPPNKKAKHSFKKTYKKSRRKANRTCKQKSSRSRSEKGTSNYIHAIMNGESLPKTKGQARAASKARYECLKKHLHLEDSGEDTDVDEMQPEFFSNAAFPLETLENDEVRCVCLENVGDEPDRVFVQCEKCGVWQHADCMGEAVPLSVQKLSEDGAPAGFAGNVIEREHKGENDDYMCHMCDTWAHRRLLMRLRAKRPLE